METGTDPHRRLTSCSLSLSLKRDSHARIPCRGRRPRRPAAPCFPPRLPREDRRLPLRMEAGTDPHRRLTSCSLPLSLKRAPTPGSPVGVGALDDPLRLAFRRASPQSIFAFPVFHLSPWANFTCLRHISRAKRISPAAGGFHCGVIHAAMGDPCDARNHPLATPEHPIPTQIFILCEYAKILSIDSPPIF